MTPQSVIRRKRDGHELSRTEMQEFVAGAVSGDWSRGQLGAMLMALFNQGISSTETQVLLDCMLHSGDLLELKGLDIPIVDKHSTGGVGDKVSLVLAPLAASCGLAVPMLSGRGLGHTGGTLDKLESIPGFRVFLSAREITSQVKRVGCVIAGQTETIVPADRILYALRDETSTVEHPSLVAASILSKKLAEDLDALLLDVKFGRGAFFPDLEDAENLARLMVELGKGAGCRVGAMLTNMDAPLGRAVGNAVEVEECVAIMKGEGPDDLAEFICQLVGGMLCLSEVEKDMDEAVKLARSRLSDGSALAKFREMVMAQDGDPAFIDNPGKLPRARHVEEILYEESTTVWVKDVDAMAIAEIVLETGAGRLNANEKVDHACGISSLVCIGDSVEPGELLARLHFSEKGKLEEWTKRLNEAIVFSPDPVKKPDLVYKKII